MTWVFSFSLTIIPYFKIDFVGNSAEINTFVTNALDMKFFNTTQVRILDQITIEQEPISSIDLMERAALALYERFLFHFGYQQPVLIVAGPGNNGGDALALAGMLLHISLDVKVLLIHSGKLSADCEINKNRLKAAFPHSLTELINEFQVPEISSDTIIIDGLFGSGLSRPLNGTFAEAIDWINNSGCKVVSIDIPSGLQGEPLAPKGEKDIIINANYTYSLQFPKLAFLLPESFSFAGKWEVLDIGIHPAAIENTQSQFSYLEKTDIQKIIITRNKFSHKGTFGHLLLLAGSKDMGGAAVLSAKAGLRSGAGLVTVHSAACNRIIVQTAIPEAIFQSDRSENFISALPALESYHAVAVGPGIGQNQDTATMLNQLFSQLKKPCVLDADALNIISQNKDLLEKIPVYSILTPHPKEFERLFGKTDNSYQRMLKASEMAVKYQFVVILKGAHTLIALPDGQLIFNSTGNAGMATAGSGDVLTGILGSLLAQGYSPENASKLGVYIHGLAGDLALSEQSEESMIAGDIVEYLGKAFYEISK